VRLSLIIKTHTGGECTYNEDDSKSHYHRQQQSPGPLGTRRGPAMHRIVKKCVHLCKAFSRTSSIVSCPHDRSTTTSTNGLI
jgi:hypothetical protein